MGGKIRPVLVAPSPLPSPWPSSPCPSQDKCMPWTNERHNRYLGYLESSFVRQLHSTMGSKTRHTDHTEMEGDIHQILPFSLHKPSEEVDVHKRRFKHLVRHAVEDSSTDLQEIPKLHTETEGDMHQILPFHLHKSSEEVDVYKRRFKHLVRHAVEDSSTDLQELPKLHSRDKNMKTIKSNCYKRSSLEDTYPIRFCHRSSDESLVECSDQNFADDIDGYQKLSPNASSAKKLKTAGPLEDTPNGDQIPFVELYSSDKAVLVHSSLEREGGKT